MHKNNIQRERPLSHVFIIPVYNEAPVIKRSVDFFYNWLSREWEGKNKNWKLVVANNASTDESKEIIDRLAESRPNLENFFVSTKGRGNALKKVVSAYSADVYFYTDIDIPVDPEGIASVVRLVENGVADVVVGKRKGERPFIRKVLTWGLKKINWLFFGMNFSDAQCGAKAFNRRGAEVLVSGCRESGYFLDTELLVLSRMSGLKVTEIGINWIENRYKDRTSKVRPLRDSFRAFRAVWGLARRLQSAFVRNVSLLAAAGFSMLALVVATRMYIAEPDFSVAAYVDIYAVMFITTCFAAWSIFAWIVLKVVGFTSHSRNLFFAIVVAFFAISAVVAILTPPIIPQDPYWNLLLVHGWTEYGHNPYLTTPLMLAGDPWSLFENLWRDQAMHQGPLWVLFLSLPALLSAYTTTAFIISKILLFAALFFSGIIFWKILDRRGVAEPSRYFLLAFMAWNFFVFQNVLIDGHSDVLVMLGILWGYLFLLEKKYIPSAIVLLLGGFIKYVSWPLIIIPLAELIRERGPRLSLVPLSMFFLIAAAITGGFILLFGFGFLASSGFHATLNGGLPEYSMIGAVALEKLFGFTYFHIRLIGIVGAIAIIIACLLSRRTLLAFTVPYLFIFLFGTGWFFPWYMLWIFPLLALWAPGELMILITVLLILTIQIPAFFASLFFLFFYLGWIFLKRKEKKVQFSSIRH